MRISDWSSDVCSSDLMRFRPIIACSSLTRNSPRYQAMSTSISILRQYQIIADISGKMLDQARADQWDQVVALGLTYQHAVDALRNMSELDDSDRAARKNLLIQILDDDARIRKKIGRANV